MGPEASVFTGILGIFVIIFFFMVAVLGFLMPIFVYQIKNELIKSNKKMDESIKFLKEIEWRLQNPESVKLLQ